MKAKHVPLNKQSKRKRNEYYSNQRRDWGNVNPVTRVKPNLKVYDRKKNGHRRAENEPMSVLVFHKRFEQVLLIILQSYQGIAL